MQDDTLVSCLMVTMPTAQRFAYAKRSIAAYCAQTHAAKELVIIADRRMSEADARLKDHVSSLERDDIVFIDAPAGLTLGALRNLSREHARGTVHCQWDDDDLHHPDRIAQQLQALLETQATAICLEDVWQFFPASRELYWTNWHATPTAAFPGAILYRADAPIHYPETGETAQLGEDTAVCKQIQSMGGLRSLAGKPQLMTYFSHGANSWDDGHHAMLARELGLSAGLLRRREGWIRDHLAEIDLGPGPITVRGPKGVAFTVEG